MTINIGINLAGRAAKVYYAALGIVDDANQYEGQATELAQRMLPTDVNRVRAGLGAWLAATARLFRGHMQWRSRLPI